MNKAIFTYAQCTVYNRYCTETLVMFAKYMYYVNFLQIMCTSDIYNF